MSADSYFNSIVDTVRSIAETQRDTIRAAAELMAGTVEKDRSIFAFGASHSFIMAEEMVYRTGGLMLVNPIYPHGMNLSVRPLTMTSRIERLPGLGAELLNGSKAAKGDLLLIFSTSGRNSVAIDMALKAAEKGVITIGVTSIAYSSAVESRHPSGQKLSEVCNVVIDNGVPYGDAVVSLEGFSGRIGPLSTVTGCALANAIVVEAVKIMVERGILPPVFMSANVDGGDEYNERLLKENAHRIHYM